MGSSFTAEVAVNGEKIQCSGPPQPAARVDRWRSASGKAPDDVSGEVADGKVALLGPNLDTFADQRGHAASSLTSLPPEPPQGCLRKIDRDALHTGHNL